MPKYPLKPLLEHREQKVHDATAELSEAVRGRAAAEEARRAAEMQRQGAEAEAAKVRDREASLLGRGELRVDDLVRGGAWNQATSARLDELARAEGAATARAEEATRSEIAARSELARKSADRDVVAKDERRFEDQEKRRALAVEEEAMEEALVARGRK
jgi:hypothetical protein